VNTEVVAVAAPLETAMTVSASIVMAVEPVKTHQEC
jgi:hypothetical protein